MAGVLLVGAGRRDAHAAQAEMDGGLRRDRVAVLEVEEIDRCRRGGEGVGPPAAGWAWQPPIARQAETESAS